MGRSEQYTLASVRACVWERKRGKNASSKVKKKGKETDTDAAAHAKAANFF